MFIMRRVLIVVIACLAAVPAAAQNRICTEISGQLNEFILPKDSAPTDPFGRILGNVKGSLEGAVTAFLTTFVPAANGNVHVTNNHAFATLEGNQLFTRGAADWVLVKPGFYQVDMTLNVAGGTGKYATATGSIHLLGIGNNIAPGAGQFVDEYRGQICITQ
jgi:hypothetical protein